MNRELKKSKQSDRPTILVAIAEANPMRLIGFRSLLEDEQDLSVTSFELDRAAEHQDVDVVIMRDTASCSLVDRIENLKATLPSARVLVTGSSCDDKDVVRVITSGAKGYINEGASCVEFASAIRIVNQGLVWGPRRAIATIIDEALGQLGRKGLAQQKALTAREKEILRMLVAGRSNKEIAAPLGIVERTVKAHVAHLMRKMGVKNRIALSVHAVTRAIVPA